jgi:hypothetical protein
MRAAIATKDSGLVFATLRPLAWSLNAFHKRAGLIVLSTGSWQSSNGSSYRIRYSIFMKWAAVFVRNGRETIASVHHSLALHFSVPFSRAS